MMKTKIIGIISCILLMTTVGLPSINGNNKGSYVLDAIGQPENIQADNMLKQVLTSSLFFTENKGQFPDEVLFQTQVSGAAVYLCKDKIVTVFAKETASTSIPALGKDRVSIRKEPVSLDVTSVVTRFEELSATVNVVGSDPAPHCNNYFIGNDPTKWYTDVPNYQMVTYHNIYQGIDLKYYSKGGSLKYDFIVQPGVDPSAINIRYEGMQQVQKTGEGDLVISTWLGSLTEKVPVLWQEIAGAHITVSGQYVTDETEGIHFQLNNQYNPEYPLVIDPTLQYSTFLGGSSSDYGYGIAVDGSGRAYITGYTYSWDFPMVNPYNGTSTGSDVFVTKFSSSGNTLVYSTYLGGDNEDEGLGIAIDSNGRAYITGYTQSSDFPMKNSYDSSFSGFLDVFVAKLSAAGNSLVYSTYLGGINHDYGEAIAVDSTGNTYVTGETSSFDFPVVNAFDSSYNGGDDDVFVAKLSSTGTTLLYSTYLGGINYDFGRDIAVDSTGNAYVTGFTQSSDFPMANPYDGTYDYDDAFITKLSPTGDSLVYSTYLGGGGSEYGNGIVVDTTGNVYVTGTTYSWDFPLVNPYDNSCSAEDIFVTKLSSGGDALLYSTYLGGTQYDSGYGIAIDVTGSAYITGVTVSSDFPMVDPYDDTFNGGYYDAFMAKLSSAGNDLLYSTYLGGTNYDYAFDIAVDKTESAYITGFTQSSDFPMVNPYNSTLNSWTDVFVSKFMFETGNQPPTFGTPTPVNGSTNQSLSLTWSIPINDPNGDHFSYTIQCSNGQSKSKTNQTNGTKSLSLTGLAYSTTYKVWVNATDPSPGSGLYTRWWYTFSTAQNQPPNKPKRPTGPATRLTGQAGTYWANGTDPDGDQIQYRFDWNASGSHSYSGWTTLVNSGTRLSKNHTWTVAGTYVVKVQSKDEHGATSTWSNGLNVTVTANQAPNQPQKPTGPATRHVGQAGTYWANGTDPDGDKIQYRFDWNASGSHQYSAWTSLVNSGQKLSKNHAWAVPGTYVVKVQSRDEHGATSVWSNGLTVIVQT
jgi:hypothetical protein